MSKMQTPFMEDIHEIIEEIKQIIAQPYVQEYVEIPVMAENRLALLYAFLREHDFDKERAKMYCVTTGLVQLGLDTHETVKITYTDDSLVAERNRQLSVLAGDYYSSYYYHLLAEAGEVEAIAILAQGIQVVNEAKMKLYLSTGENSPSAHQALCKTIDTALYVAFVQAWIDDANERQYWTNLIEETSAFEQVTGESQELKWQSPMPFRPKSKRSRLGLLHATPIE